MLPLKILQSWIHIFRYIFITLTLLISVLILLVLLSDSLYTLDGGREQNHSVGSFSTKITKPNKVTFSEINNNNNYFNISSSQDFLVLLHIQKTGGTTFERHLVQDLDIQNPCSCVDDRRRCWCPKLSKSNVIDKTKTDRTWLISRFSTGWVCGLHADWTQLNKCLASLDRLFFVTFLRHPLHRFVSELRHVQRGATWKASKIHCKGYDTQICYGEQPNWLNVRLEDFMGCTNNMAINRQTYMLADMNLIRCNNDSNFHSHHEGSILLENAKYNLERMAFFGLCEEQKASQIIFEETFKLKFLTEFRQSEDNKTKIMIDQMPTETRKRIIELNHLDMKLYDFAIDLFEARCKALSSKCENALVRSDLKKG